MTDRSYDPNKIIKAAEDKLSSNDIEGGQMLFQSALLDWVDDARENSTSVDPEQMREAIATLWLAYAHFLMRAKQFKSTTEAYEQAVSCPVSGMVGRIWLDYARFAEDRGKLRTAQQIYLRALVGDNDNAVGAVTDEQDQTLLWNEFLEMMRKSNPSLTLAELKTAVETEHRKGGEATTADVANTDNPDAPQLVGSMTSTAPPTKRQKTNDGAEPPIKAEDVVETKSHVVTAQDVQAEENVLQELTQNIQKDPDFMAAWMIRDGDGPPQPPQPPLFTAAPPKLTDPTGKDLLGEELALSIVQRLVEPTGGVLLEVCRGLWMMTAIKEEKAKNVLDQLDKNIQEESDKLESTLSERLAVSGAAEAAVRMMNQNELTTFQNNCNQQRQNVLNGIAWEFRQLLWMQQQILTKLKVPGFEGATVEASALEHQSRVCSYLHSAFYLRKRIGEESHLKMLNSQTERLKQAVAAAATARANSPVPPRSTTPPPPSMYANNYPGMVAQQQQQPQLQTSFPPQQLPPPPPPPPPPPHYMNPPPMQVYGAGGVMPPNMPGGYPGQPLAMTPQLQQQLQQQQQQQQMMQNMPGIYPPPHQQYYQ